MSTGKKYRGGYSEDFKYWEKEGRELSDQIRNSQRPGLYKHQAILDYWETIRDHSTGDVTGSHVRPINGEGEEL